jgi:hypothetical protein
MANSVAELSGERTLMVVADRIPGYNEVMEQRGSVLVKLLDDKSAKELWGKDAARMKEDLDALHQTELSLYGHKESSDKLIKQRDFFFCFPPDRGVAAHTHTSASNVRVTNSKVTNEVFETTWGAYIPDTTGLAFVTWTRDPLPPLIQESSSSNELPVRKIMVTRLRADRSTFIPLLIALCRCVQAYRASSEKSERFRIEFTSLSRDLQSLCSQLELCGHTIPVDDHITCAKVYDTQLDDSVRINWVHNER